MRVLIVSTLLAASVFAADVPLFNAKNLDGWQSVGDGQWTVMADGTLLGQRTTEVHNLMKSGLTQDPVKFNQWLNTQAWLYTVRNDFDEFDLHLEYWTKTHGNSGVSIRDTSRAKWAVSDPPDFKRTPSKVAYEIQINNRYPDPHPAGSIYGFMDAPKEATHEEDWNTMDIHSRRDKITVELNGRKVAEHPGDPQRPKTGPIGLQLHDQFSIIMFRNIRIHEIGK